MKRFHFLFVGLALLAGCNPLAAPNPPASAEPTVVKRMTFAEARKRSPTKLVRKEADGRPLPEPPPELFRKITYESPAGKLGGYLTPDPKDQKKHPGIVWITGGDCNTIDDGVWEDSPPDNDQTARQYREAGIVMLFPSLRGGNDNPGFHEGFYGELDDVVAAADFLASQNYVDPARVYLGGHSSGGTMVLLAAEYSNRFRAVFSFGPTSSLRDYPEQFHVFDTDETLEFDLRSPASWLHCIEMPVFVIEGRVGGGANSLLRLAEANKNALVRFYPVAGANHFDILAPTNRLIAKKILEDTGPECNIDFTLGEIEKAFAKGSSN